MLGDLVKKTYFVIVLTALFYLGGKCFNLTVPVTVSKGLSLKDVSIVIDPGHGGLDNGASVGRVYESELNLKISFALKDELENRGAKVYLTREDEQDMTKRNHHYSKQDDMYLRVKKIDEYKCDYLISIHLNSAPVSSAWGSQVFYYKNSEKGKRLATEIQTAMREVTGSPKPISGSSFRVLRATQTVGVLVECGFISNANERGQLQSGKYHQKLAIKICDGLENYRQKYPEDSVKPEDYEELLS